MRTTVDLPQDVHDLARAVARVTGVSLGQAIALLVRSGLRRPGIEVRTDATTGLPVVHLGRPITIEDVRALDDCSMPTS